MSLSILSIVISYMSTTTFLQNIEEDEKREQAKKAKKNKQKAERKKERNAKNEAASAAPPPYNMLVQASAPAPPAPRIAAPPYNRPPPPPFSIAPAPPYNRPPPPPASRIVTAVATPAKNEAKNEAENEAEAKNAYKSLFMTWNKFKRLNEVEQKRIINLFPITDKDFEGLNIGNAVENEVLTQRIRQLYNNGLISFNTKNRTRKNLRFLAERGLIPPNNEFGTLYVNGVSRNVWNARRTQKKKAQNARITQNKKAQNAQNAQRKQKENEELILKLKTPIRNFNKYINSNDNYNPSFFQPIRRFFSTPNEREMTEMKKKIEMNRKIENEEEKYP